MGINLDNLNHNLRIILIRIINSSNVYRSLFIRIIIKVINGQPIKIIKIINNDFKLIKIIKETLISRY